MKSLWSMFVGLDQCILGQHGGFTFDYFQYLMALAVRSFGYLEVGIKERGEYLLLVYIFFLGIKAALKVRRESR